jgi:hypothetical protein
MSFEVDIADQGPVRSGDCIVVLLASVYHADSPIGTCNGLSALGMKDITPPTITIYLIKSLHSHSI